LWECLSIGLLMEAAGFAVIATAGHYRNRTEELARLKATSCTLVAFFLTDLAGPAAALHAGAPPPRLKGLWSSFVHGFKSLA
jgi:hypothetical protein